jgi:hypothetical protein
MAMLVMLAASIVLMTDAIAQVDCRNGKYCPAGNVCLKGDVCGEAVEAPPGSIRTASGAWCEPGFREHKHNPGSCVPSSYSDCPNGRICPPGTTCGAGGGCTGGRPATGPECGGRRCEEGRICSSAGGCMNPTYYQDCGGGTICSKNKACAQDGGCAIVGIARTPQIPFGKQQNPFK